MEDQGELSAPFLVPVNNIIFPILRLCRGGGDVRNIRPSIRLCDGDTDALPTGQQIRQELLLQLFASILDDRRQTERKTGIE
jgi:hypothetical protein